MKLVNRESDFHFNRNDYFLIQIKRNLIVSWMLKNLYIRGMLFNSFVFLVFFLVFFSIYWAIPSSRLKWQNVVLWLASYIFYGWWDWRYLALIAGASLVSYGGGKLMEKLPSYRKVVLTGVVIFHIAMLAWF